MPPLKPRAELPTHDVLNTPPHMGNQDLWAADLALREGVAREGAGWARPSLETFGQRAGNAETFEKADEANRWAPELKAFDRYGMRINQVAFHPAYHDLMALAIGNEIPNFAWHHRQPGAQVAHMALSYMLNQAEGGVMCPMAMTYAAIPVLTNNAGAPAGFLDKALSTNYDARDVPWPDKTGVTVGMFMTEKQGGSDVRANTTRATPMAAQAALAPPTTSPATSSSAQRRCRMRSLPWPIQTPACPASSFHAGRRAENATRSSSSASKTSSATAPMLRPKSSSMGLRL